MAAYQLVFVLQLISVANATPFCIANTTVSTPAPNAPPFPTLPGTFQTRVEANIIDKKMTVSAQEYFNSQKDRATLIMASEGNTPDTLVYDYTDNQLFYVHGGRCQVNDLLHDPNSFLFGNKIQNGVPHTFTSNGALHFMKTYGQTYMGQSLVRGINADHWRACLSWPNPNATFFLDYYFTAMDWVNPVSYQQLPLRAEATGVQVTKNSTQRMFHHIYDYFEFRLDLTVEDTIFETPAGVYCANRKPTKKMVGIINSKAYHYRLEVISEYDGNVQTSIVYYNENYKLVRYDYKNLANLPPTYSQNPLSEVHDYNAGVRYIKDLVIGNCSVLPLSNGSIDSVESHETFYGNGTEKSGYSLHMKNPLQFLKLDANYDYVGQRRCRGNAMCDVFSGIRSDYLDTNGFIKNATYDYYFLSEDFSEISIDSSSYDPTDVPYQLLVTLLGTDGSPEYSVTYNFVDYVFEDQDISLFDVSSCYSAAANLQFQVRIPGVFYKTDENLMKIKAQAKFAEILQVSYIRVQDVRLDYDNSNVYISATVLDRTPPSAQFTYIPAKELSRSGDLQYSNVLSPQDCAKNCITNYDFTCNSFEFCPVGTGNCRLNRRHKEDGTTTLSSSQCDHYSRNINGPTVQETPVDEAYDNLKTAVYQKKFRLQIFGQQTFDSYAVDIRILFGWMENVSLPSITGQFSYGLEIVDPATQNVISSNVWYDMTYGLVRFDLTNTEPTPPFYTTNPTTTIEDFNTGISYTIDRSLGNCSVNSIQLGSFGTEQDKAAMMKNGAFVIKMKGPLDIFSLNESYRWAGQRTVRGMLCDVFEATTTDFKVPSITQTFTSVLQFFFMTDSWSQTSDTDPNPVNSQPVKLTISSAEVGLFMTYNFYNFNEEDPDLKNFDITPCFTADKQENFVMVFNGSYHPYLDVNLKTFEKAVRIMMAESSKASPLRFQNLEVSYDSYAPYIFLIGTLVDPAPSIDDFTLTEKGMHPPKSAATISKITSAAACANQCRQNQNFLCQGFYFCVSSSTCVISQSHVDSGPLLYTALSCDHYSRTVNSTIAVQPTVDEALSRISNAVYGGEYQFPVSYGTSVYTFNATMVRTSVLRNGRPNESNLLLTHFYIYRQYFIFTKTDTSFSGISVEDCARRCISNLEYECLSFSYCFDLGDCFLSHIHADNSSGIAQRQEYCDLYSRYFLDQYTVSSGVIYSVKADATIPNVPTANLCAKMCSQYTKFPCKSFEYCTSTKNCLLLKVHELDLEATAASPSLTCTFYSRNFIHDFKLLQRKTITFANVLEFSNVSSSQCAKLCVEQEGSACRSFAYCNMTSLCRLTSSHPRQADNSVSQSDTCDLYSRRFYNPSSYSRPSINKAQTSSRSQANGYSPGAMAAVALSLFIAGLAIGILGLYFYNYKKAIKSGDNIDLVEQYGDNPNYDNISSESDSNSENTPKEEAADS
ncbi:uncharacterized protein LOC133199694 [Saccostrea echinata]|uniref:uncharacterized protein LOC133199694 n=1 Tax=Saccostrea echinata TaxID=191078 RepID=UPI002A808E25|nr:uncharacterized protein LOC133199694 [Saccostrea echinata]